MTASCSCVTAASSANPRRLRRCRLGQHLKLTSEVVNAIEVFVDACESHVGNVVEQSELIKHGETNLRGGDFRTERPQAVFNSDGQRIDRLARNRSTLRRTLDARHDLGRMKRLTIARAFQNDEHRLFKPLVRGETIVTRDALPTAANGCAIVGRTRVDNSSVVSSAYGTSHTRRVAATAITVRSGTQSDGSGDDDLLANANGVATVGPHELIDIRGNITTWVDALSD
jgi:hypothetical protein